jgi:hypothetical protein
MALITWAAIHTRLRVQELHRLKSRLSTAAWHCFSQGGNNDPKLDALVGYLLGMRKDVERRWLDLGCILFSQYYDTVRWVGDELGQAKRVCGHGDWLYAGSNRSGIWSAGRFQRCEREVLKARVRAGELKLLLGTDAASEGLNLQRLGTLINIDLPWNPRGWSSARDASSALARYAAKCGSPTCAIAARWRTACTMCWQTGLESIHQLFGQIPDTLEDVWVKLALEGEKEALQLIDRTSATRNPFDAKYSKVEDADWETCSLVLDPQAVKEQLSRGW